MRAFVRAVVLAAGVVGAVVLTAGPVMATSITDPSGDVVTVTVKDGKAAPFTVVAKGFEPYQSVYIEQCNGRTPADDPWDPAIDCDFGSAPAAAIADTAGTVTFTATDPNHALRPFVGASPQGLFNCLPPSAASPKNDLPDFRDCQVRVSSNNTRSTSDQVFVHLRLPVLPVGAPAGQSGAGSSGSGQVASDQSGSGHNASDRSSRGGSGQSASDPSGSSQSKVPYIGALALVALATGAAAFVLYRCRTRRVAA